MLAVLNILTISGSDCSGQSGIQADIKTVTAHKMYAMSAVTALTAQNTTGILRIVESESEFVGQQLDCIFNDIRPDAVKIGMVLNADIIDVIAEKLAEYKAENIVIDPVMVAASGGRLPDDNAVATLVTRLFPLGTVITPNIPEAEALTGMRIASGVNIFSQNNMMKAAEALSVLTKGAILIKGGHLECTADDLLYVDGTTRWFTSERIEHPNTRGSGSTLSAAIACNLAAGLSLEDSVKNAKAYVTGALKAGLDRGLLDHMWNV